MVFQIDIDTVDLDFIGWRLCRYVYTVCTEYMCTVYE